MAYLYYLNDIINQINLKNYEDYYGFDLDFDDARIHRFFNIFRRNKASALERYSSINVWYTDMFSDEKTIKYGLFYEMIRYLFLIYPEIYDYHFNKVNDVMKELKMEIWIKDFDKNAGTILDALNLIDTPKNRDVLMSNGVMDVNISTERELLLGMMRTQDTKSKVIADFYEYEQVHIHINRNDTKYIHALLTIDIQICLLLKHITNLVQYGWHYHDYC